MSAPPLRIGIAGVGRMGRHHASNLAQRVVGAELVAACSPVADELAWARDTLGVAHGYKDYAQLLAHPGLDAVFLATPTTLHADQIVGALEAGKHVFSEKPLALNLDDCLRVEAVAAKHPRQIAMIGYVRRFDPSYRDAFDKIKAGAIGRPFLARSQTTDKNDASGFFVRYAGASGGILLDMSVHDIDTVRWLLGAERREARVRDRDDRRPRRPARSWRCRQRRRDDRVRRRRDRHDLRVADDGARSRDADRDRRHLGTAHRRAEPPDQSVEISDAHGVRNECTPTFYERFADAFREEAQAFVDVVRENRPPPLTLADATEATRIGIAVTESLRSRRMVEV